MSIKLLNCIYTERTKEIDNHASLTTTFLLLKKRDCLLTGRHNPISRLTPSMRGGDE